jgi:hypothetical protein
MREDRRVILAIILGTSAMLAAWAGYWWSSVLLGAKANRASRTASVISPFPIAAILAWAAGPLLDAIGFDIGSVASLNPKEIAAIFFAVAIVLLIPTVLIAMLAGQLFDKRTPAKN